MEKELELLFGHKGANIIAKGVIIHGTHDFSEGFLIEVEDIKKQIENLQGQDGITLSGGDPFFQPEAVKEIAKFCKGKGFSVWAYTGFTFEELQEKSKTDLNLKELMKNIDVLVDGKFILEQKSLNIKFRGSRNQRIIDMPQSLKQAKAIEIEKYNEINYLKIENTRGKTKNMYI